MLGCHHRTLLDRVDAWVDVEFEDILRMHDALHRVIRDVTERCAEGEVKRFPEDGHALL
jgi:hypothetical protein